MGMRVIKTAIAALAAIYTALTIGLDPPVSAGLLAILGVEATRMKGLKSSFARFVASVLGLFLASIIFIVLGFHLPAVSLFILIVFPVLSRLGLKDGIVTSSVIVFHVFAKEEVTAGVIANEILLLVTGLGWATVINMIYMPREENKLVRCRTELEESLGGILREMAATLRNPARLWDGQELLKAHAACEEGARLAELSRENRLWGAPSYWETYFEMRRQQLEAIQQMLVQLAFVYDKMPQGELVAKLFDHLADDVKSDVYKGEVEEKLHRLKERFKRMELPRTREEFEVRAAILQLCHELERCLAIARRWKKKSHSGEPHLHRIERENSLPPGERN